MERKKAQSQPKKKTLKTCGVEPFDLKSKVSNLEKTLKNQEKVIKGMYKHLSKKDDKENTVKQAKSFEEILLQIIFKTNG